ncbi:N-formylglutamate amidohydrolase [Fulvivirga lutimaris]|uniref:N-formylglutamate amidohydrolase n=1 Tax=Fulvivirga lutimaris TaxID=1819566 RepID=UPI0012BC5751|nr:N-formylglutamate amidohydrolase [Fulvivirga lutimaris]MTI39585.1 N-formylglutamate amidohydrolase [Fulvivirga lutimaris]
MGKSKIIISCEHAGNYIPKLYSHLFEGKDEILASHRGWDMGSIELGKYVARHLEAPFFFQKVSRLLVEANRSLDNVELFSEFTAQLPQKQKQQLIDSYHLAYRQSVITEIDKALTSFDSVIHISMHSFTPVLNGVERSVDIGVLVDESIEEEAKYANELKDKISEAIPEMLTMINLPYNGADDGFTTYLRNQYSPDKYLGVELEINQKFVGTAQMEVLKRGLVKALGNDL